jgi:hypothetical protein
MERLFYVLFLMAGISLASFNVSNAQDAKVKGTCCTKAKVTAGTVKSDDPAAKISSVALTTDGTAKTADCTAKTGAMAEGKACSGACTHKTGAVTETKTTAKTGVVAEAEVKGK